MSHAARFVQSGRRFYSSHQHLAASSSSDLRSCYRELGLPFGAGIPEVKNAYRHRALQCHPDLHPSKGDEFVRLRDAYDRILTNKGRCYGTFPSAAAAQGSYQGWPTVLWSVSLVLGIVLFWYPTQMYLERCHDRQKGPFMIVAPTRDAVKRERIAAILLERQRRSKTQGGDGASKLEVRTP